MNKTPTPHLYLAIELSLKTWKLSFSTREVRNPRLADVSAGDIEALFGELSKARTKLKLPEDVPVLSCYEAGRDGFWLHRLLESRGVSNVVVDAASIERPARRMAKSDRLDARMLVRKLMNWDAGDEQVWRVVRIPSPEVEAERALNREWRSLKKDRTRLVSQIRSVLAFQGIQVRTLNAALAAGLEEFRDPLDNPLSTQVQARLGRMLEHLGILDTQLKTLADDRRSARRAPTTDAERKIEKFTRLKAIGDVIAETLVRDFFWREFDNRRQVGAAAGLVGVPYASGEVDRDTGISKAGNGRVRSVMIEAAWLWVRYQPQSELTLWFQQRYGPGSRQSRKVGITALARKLLIALWRYLEDDVVPKGAVFLPST